MSWETLVVGSFGFKEGVAEDEKRRILAELEDVLETKPDWDDTYKEYDFGDTNWTSHVRGEEIKEAVERNKKFLSCFECSLYYLSEADEQINLEPGSDEVEAILC